jgi:hypothetical protein
MTVATSWQEQTASASSVTGVGGTVIANTVGIAGVAIEPVAAAANGGASMTAGQYIATLSQAFRALPDAPDDDESIDFEPDAPR